MQSDLVSEGSFSLAKNCEELFTELNAIAPKSRFILPLSESSDSVEQLLVEANECLRVLLVDDSTYNLFVLNELIISINAHVLIDEALHG